MSDTDAADAAAVGLAGALEGLSPTQAIAELTTALAACICFCATQDVSGQRVLRLVIEQLTELVQNGPDLITTQTH